MNGLNCFRRQLFSLPPLLSWRDQERNQDWYCKQREKNQHSNITAAEIKRVEMLPVESSKQKKGQIDGFPNHVYWCAVRFGGLLKFDIIIDIVVNLLYW